MISKSPSAIWFVGTVLVVALLVGSMSIDSLAAETESYSVYLPLVMVPSFEDIVVSLTNHERAANGCGPLIVDARLQAAAEGHSLDMALNDFVSHTGSDGSSPWDRIHAQGYDYWIAAENIAAGYPTPESVVAGWMESPGHRANILNCSFVHIGVGYYYLPNDTGSVNYYHYWTQDFAAP